MIFEGGKMTEKIVKSDAEWQEVLTDEEYRVMRKKGTERAFSVDRKC
jgi:peptide-methionine (R)-S-oxide reductase